MLFCVWFSLMLWFLFYFVSWTQLSHFMVLCSCEIVLELGKPKLHIYVNDVILSSFFVWFVLWDFLTQMYPYVPKDLLLWTYAFYFMMYIATIWLSFDVHDNHLVVRFLLVVLNGISVHLFHIFTFWHYNS